MSWLISALTWAATNQQRLDLIVAGIGALLTAYRTVRASLIASGGLSAQEAAVYDRALTDTLRTDAEALESKADDLLDELRS